jgi:hypothetical protein
MRKQVGHIAGEGQSLDLNPSTYIQFHSQFSPGSVMNCTAGADDLWCRTGWELGGHRGGVLLFWKHFIDSARLAVLVAAFC